MYCAIYSNESGFRNYRSETNRLSYLVCFMH